MAAAAPRQSAPPRQARAGAAADAGAGGGAGVYWRGGAQYRSAARAVLVGHGADELCGGYGRHRTRFREQARICQSPDAARRALDVTTGVLLPAAAGHHVGYTRPASGPWLGGRCTQTGCTRRARVEG